MWITTPAVVMAALAASAAVPAAVATAAGDRASQQTTLLVSRARDGGLPNGPSSNGVISRDRRWARLIAYQSAASNLVKGDTNGLTDVFAVRRAGRVTNLGTTWRRGTTRLISHARGGGPANGPSWAPAVDGALHRAPRCVAFLSAASNLVRGDGNGRVDAFVAHVRSGRVWRVSHGNTDATQVAISGDCTRVAFAGGGVVRVRVHGRTVKAGTGADPAFSTGLRNDLVYGGSRGVYLSRGGTRKSRLVARGGRDPAFNDVRRQVVAYERRGGGHWQVMFHELGHREQVASARDGRLGNGDSSDPVIGNSGYYIAFETEASNLGVNATRRIGDFNGVPDTYLYTGVRDLTLVQSVEQKAVPLFGGGRHPSMSFLRELLPVRLPRPAGKPLRRLAGLDALPRRRVNLARRHICLPGRMADRGRDPLSGGSPLEVPRAPRAQAPRPTHPDPA
jgi:hypothetical protein